MPSTGLSPDSRRRGGSTRGRMRTFEARHGSKGSSGSLRQSSPGLERQIKPTSSRVAPKPTNDSFDDTDDQDSADAQPQNTQAHEEIAPDFQKDRSSKEDDGNAVQNSETKADKKDGAQTASNDKEQKIQKDSDDTDSGIKDSTGKRRVRWSRRRTAGVSVGIGLIGGSTLVGILLLAPLKIITWGQWLKDAHFFSNEERGNDSTSKLTLLRRYTGTGTPQGTRLGAISAKYAARWESRLINEAGVVPLYDNLTGRMVGFDVINEQKAAQLISSLSANDINTDTVIRNASSGINGNPAGSRHIDMRNVPNRAKRAAITQAVELTDHNRISSRIGTRVLKRLSGVTFHPITDLRDKLVDNAVTRYRDYKDAKETDRAEKIERGATDPDPPRATGQNEVDAEGNETETPKTSSEAFDDGTSLNSAELAEDFNGDVEDLKNTPTTDLLDAKKSIAQKLVKGGKGAAVALALMCAAQEVGESALAARYASTVLNSSRMGFEFIALSAQLMTLKNIDLNAIRYYWDIMSSEEAGDVFESAAAVAATGGDPTNASTLGLVGTADINDKPAFFDILDNVPFLGTLCSASNGLFGIIGKIPIAGSIVEIANDLQGRAINLAIQGVTAGRYTLEEIIGGVVDWVAGNGVNILAEGAELGNITMSGARFAANTLALAIGGRELSAAETGELKTYLAESKRQDLTSRSLFDRYLSLERSESLASRTIAKIPANPSKSPALFLNGLTGFASLPQTLIPTASANSTPFDYGVPLVGFSVDELNSDIRDDPYGNAVIVEERFDELNGQYGECFPNKLSLVGDEVVLTVPTFAENPITQFTQDEKCKTDRSEDYLRFRVYLESVTDLKSINCYEGDDGACREIGMSSAPIVTGGDPTQINGQVFSCEGEQRAVIRDDRGGTARSIWNDIPPTDTLGNGSSGQPINVYIRDSCTTANQKTILIVSSIHGSENGGQLVAHELLFNEALPNNVRIVVVPEMNKAGIDYRVTNGFGGRVNGRGVNLNRNSDYRWSNMSNNQDNIDPDSTNFRGEGPNSEPETAAVQAFIRSLGPINASFHYHDDLAYVASSHNDLSLEIAAEYAAVTGLRNQNSRGESIIRQSGSLDGWQAETIGGKVILVEMAANQSSDVIGTHVEAIKSIIAKGLL